MPLTRIRQRQLVLAWIGIVLAWAFSSFVGVVLVAERSTAAVVATTVVALAVGALVTRRLTPKEHRASVTTRDLRAHRKGRG